MSETKQWTLVILVGIALGVGYHLVKSPAKPQVKVKSAQEVCVDSAMESNTKRQTAEMAFALHLQRTDQAHLIKYIDLREAVKATYCNK